MNDESKPPGDRPQGAPDVTPMGLFSRPMVPRHEKVRRQFQRSQDSRIPTWAYALALAAVVAALAAVVIAGRT